LNKDEQTISLPYAQLIKFCDDTERKVHFLVNKCNEYRIKMYKPADADVFIKQIERIGEDKKKAYHLLFDEIEPDFSEK
jgi:hypothetical protein